MSCLTNNRNDGRRSARSGCARNAESLNESAATRRKHRRELEQHQLHRQLTELHREQDISRRRIGRYSSSAAFQTHMLGMSRGQYVSDPECERRRDAKVLADLQMRVAAVARLCQNESVWKSMFISGTPCPLLRGGRLVVGKRAYLALKQNPNLYIPDYEEKMDWYNAILGIGKTNETNSKEDSDSDLSISERFRSSLGSDSE